MFRFLTAGESHGKGLAVIIEGLPAGVPLSEDYIACDLRRRQGGYGRSVRQQMEQDRAEIRSGVRHGLTLGSPVSLLIENRVWSDWQEVMRVEPIGKEIERLTRLRPGHADLTGAVKYGFDDVRNVLERASARETAARVAVGAVARRFIEEFGIEVHSHSVDIGGVRAQPAQPIDWAQVEASPVRCADASAEQHMITAIDAAREAGDTIGGVFEVVATGVPIGLGSHVHWERKLSARLAQAVMSINAVKGVEIGDGFGLASQRGSQSQDTFLPSNQASRPWQRATNHAGGVEGGISDGEPIVVRAVIKPIATMTKPLPSVDLLTGLEVQAHYERSDVCQVPAGGVVGEAMVAIVLADTMLEKFGGDHLAETKRNYEAYLKTIGPRGERG